MELINYPRFLKAIDEAIQGLELEARCYGYLADPEHIELIQTLQAYRAKMKTEKNQAETAWNQQMQEKIFDVASAELLPGKPDECPGNGQHPSIECCCDECDHFLACFPEWLPGGEAWKEKELT